MHRSVFFLVILSAIVFAGCGDDDGGGSTKSTKGKAEPTKPVASGEGIDLDIELKYTLEQIGSKDSGAVPIPTRANCTKSLPASCTGELSCPAAEGSPEEDFTVCAWMARTGAKAFAQPPENQVCTMIYGGPETATVTGTFDGKPVTVGLSRNDGCAIARWESFEPLWTGDVPSV